MQASKKNIIITYISLFVLGIIGYAGKTAFDHSLEPKIVEAKILEKPKSIPTFELKTANGSLNNDSLKNHWTLAYFGYVSCPDICPTTLSTLKNTIKILDEKHLSDKVQVVFVSVDPKRDTPENLKQYTQFFDQRFVGATADKQNLDILTRAVGVPYGTFENPGSKANYLVDHGSNVIILNPKGEFHGYFSAPQKAELLAGDLEIMLK
jgi:protein SCO1/2